MKEIYEQTPAIDEHLQYALFSCQPTTFYEAMKDAQWVQVNEEDKHDEVVSFNGEHQDVNDLQEELKYIHIFSDKIF